MKSRWLWELSEEACYFISRHPAVHPEPPTKLTRPWNKSQDAKQPSESFATVLQMWNLPHSFLLVSHGDPPHLERPTAGGDGGRACYNIWFLQTFTFNLWSLSLLVCRNERSCIFSSHKSHFLISVWPHLRQKAVELKRKRKNIERRIFSGNTFKSNFKRAIFNTDDLICYHDCVFTF